MPPRPPLAPCLNRFSHSSFPHPRFEKAERVCMPYCLRRFCCVCVCFLVSVSLSSDFMLYFRLCQNVVAILSLNGYLWVILHPFLHLFCFFTCSIHLLLKKHCIHTHIIHTVSIYDVCSHCDCMRASLNENMTGQIYVHSHVWYLAKPQKEVNCNHAIFWLKPIEIIGWRV